MNALAAIRHSALLSAILAAVLLSGIGLAAWSGLLLGNATTSVPRGFYVRAGPDTATYVTFCLGRRHGAAERYRHFCSPDNPDGLRILKRIGERRERQVMVEGDGPRALDSRVLGPVRMDEIRGWWRPLIQAGARSHGD